MIEYFFLHIQFGIYRKEKTRVLMCLTFNTCQTIVDVKTSYINISKINGKVNYSKSQYCVALTQSCCCEIKKKKIALLNFRNILHTGDPEG